MRACSFLSDSLRPRGLSSYDAVHACSCTLVGAEMLVTTDRGFSALSESDLVIATTVDRVRSYRRNRARLDLH